nr:YjiH family protein [uncultured Dethiosulfovibrio sp.]
MENGKSESFSASRLAKFIVPSLLGVFLLMTPLVIDGRQTVLVSLMSKATNVFINDIIPIPILVLVFITISTLLALFCKLSAPSFIMESNYWKKIFDISWFWVSARVLGFVIAFMVYFKLGPEILWSDYTGGLILHDLIGGLFTVFLIAGFILPLLTDFGLLEFIGVYLTKIMRPVFRLPGRSAIDCIASWVGDGTIGVALTNRQYTEGYYTAKEAAIISTTFSAVSITFCLVVLENIGMMDYFAHYYLAVTVAGIAAALIVPRIPPLSRKSDDYYHGERKEAGELIPDGLSRTQWGLSMAVKKADDSGHVGHLLMNGGKTVLDLWLGVLPIIMAFGTLALVLAESTPIFQWLGMPFMPLLHLLGVPEATAASHTLVVGFADMVVPSLMADSITSPMTKFIVGAVSVTQLIYMSETGAVILGSDIPVDLKDLFIIFIERTIITLPIVCLFAKLFF